MADNFKYEIYKCGLDEKSKVRYSSVVSSKKFREEYEAIVLETINYECSSVLNEIKSVNTKEIAKAVVDRLFGEGE